MQPLRVSTSRPSMTEEQSAALARQSAALFASLKQLHELMSGPRGKELSPKSTGVSGAAGSYSCMFLLLGLLALCQLIPQRLMLEGLVTNPNLACRWMPAPSAVQRAFFDKS
eukprot:1151347-Pelagomonas_calceolata.AAC.6